MLSHPSRYVSHDFGTSFKLNPETCICQSLGDGPLDLERLFFGTQNKTLCLKKLKLDSRLRHEPYRATSFLLYLARRAIFPFTYGFRSNQAASNVSHTTKTNVAAGLYGVRLDDSQSAWARTKPFSFISSCRLVTEIDNHKRTVMQPMLNAY